MGECESDDNEWETENSERHRTTTTI